VQKVQDIALNGAQMSSLQAIVQAVADGLLPTESALQIISISVPAVDPTVVQSMVAAASKFSTTKRTSPTPGAEPGKSTPPAGPEATPNQPPATAGA
jgi:hypothetical protein